MKKNNEIEDDNRIIADMNVDGMPWHTKKRSEISNNNRIDFTKKERRAMVFSGLLMALLVGIVFVIIFFLIFLGLDLLWLK